MGKGKRTRIKKKNKAARKVIKKNNYAVKLLNLFRAHAPLLLTSVLLPLLILFIATIFINYMESDLAFRFENKNSNGDYVFVFVNNSKIDWVIRNSAIGLSNVAYLLKDIKELDKEGKVTSGKGWTKIKSIHQDFIAHKKYGWKPLNNIIGLPVKVGEQKRVIIDDIKRGDSSVFIADFYIGYYCSPKNSLLNLIHNLVQKLGFKKGFGTAMFRLEDGQVYDIVFSPSEAEFEKMARDKLKKSSVEKYNK